MIQLISFSVSVGLSVLLTDLINIVRNKRAIDSQVDHKVPIFDVAKTKLSIPLHSLFVVVT